MGFAPETYLPDDAEERLKVWDSAPELGPEVLTEPPARRLGHYFERLYECLMQDLLGWEVMLKNQPVRSNGITLGELDFLVRNPADNVVEHHEVAVKFYLGHQNDCQARPLWYGPNTRDRLDLKTQRLTDHQSQLTARPETRNLLASLDIQTPVRPRIFMPGYLFYPLDMPLSPPECIPVGHLRGDWLYISDLDEMNATGNVTAADGKRWIPLAKPHWLPIHRAPRTHWPSFDRPVSPACLQCWSGRQRTVTGVRPPGCLWFRVPGLTHKQQRPKQSPSCYSENDKPAHHVKLPATRPLFQ